MIVLRVPLFAQGKLAGAVFGQGNRVLKGLRFVGGTGDLERGETIELTLLRDFTQVDEVTFFGSVLDRADAEAQAVLTRRHAIDDVLGFLPAGRVFRRQVDEFDLVDVAKREQGSALGQRVFEVTSIAGAILFKSANAEFGFLLINDAVLGLTAIEESLSLFQTAFEVTVVCAADFGVGVLLHLTALRPHGGFGRVWPFQLHPVDPDRGWVAVAVLCFQGVVGTPERF